MTTASRKATPLAGWAYVVDWFRRYRLAIWFVTLDAIYIAEFGASPVVSKCHTTV